MSRNTKGVAPVVTTESDGRNTTRHPAFGCLSINRVSGGSRNFFGSDVRHDHYISLRLNPCSRNSGAAASRRAAKKRKGKR